MRHPIRTAAAALTLVAGLALVGAACGTSKADTPTKDKAETSQPAAPETTSSYAGRRPVITLDTPKVSDFELTVKETEREHFGSAGDIVGYKVKLAVDKSKTFDPAITYDLTYKVFGGEDGPETKTIEVTGDSYENPGEDHLDTHANVRVTVKIVSVEEG